MNVHLYALSTCPYCRMTKKFLDEHDVSYELTEVDLLEGEVKDEETPKGSAAAEVKRLSGGTSFPVLVVDDEIVVGFNKGRMTDVLGL
jgi:glutaredoxin